MGEPRTARVAAATTDDTVSEQARQRENASRKKRVADASKDMQRLEFSPGQVVGFVVGCLLVVSPAILLSLVLFGAVELGSQVIVLVSLLFLFGLALALTIYFTTMDDRNWRRSLWEIDETTVALAGASPTPNIREILKLNRIEMTNYHELAKRHAARSFTNSLVAMWLGILVVVGSILLLAVPNFVDSGSKLTIAAVGTVGTIVSGFVTRTFMKQHSLSIDQLNRFFDQPLVTSYLLNAERVALQLSEPQRTEAFARIVERALDVSLIRPPAAPGKPKSGL